MAHGVGAVGAGAVSRIPAEEHNFTQPIVTWIRSWEWDETGAECNLFYQTIAKVMEFLILVPCFFSLVGIIPYLYGVVEYGRQDGDRVIPDAGPAGAADAELEAEVHRLEGALQQANDRAAQAGRAVTDLTAQLQQARANAGDQGRLAAENDNLLKGMEQALKGKTKAETELADTQRQLRELKQQAEQNRKGLDGQLNAYQTQISELQNTLKQKEAALKASTDQAGGAATELQRQLAEAQRQLAEARTQNSGLREQNQLQVKAAADAQTALGVLQGRFNDLQGQLKTQGGNLATMTTRATGAEEQLAKLREELNAATGKAAKLEGRLGGMTDKAKADQAQADLQSRLDAAKADAERLKGQLGGMTDKAKADQAQADLQTQLNTAKADAERLKAQLGGMTDKAKAEGALTDAMNRLKAALARVKQLEEEKAKLGDIGGTMKQVLLAIGVAEDQAEAVRKAANPVQSFENHFKQMKIDWENIAQTRLRTLALAVQQTVSGENGVMKLIDEAAAAIAKDPKQAQEQARILKETLSKRFADAAPVQEKPKKGAKPIGGTAANG